MVSLRPRCGLTLTPFVAAEMSHKQMFASSDPLRRCPSVKGFQARPYPSVWCPNSLRSVAGKGRPQQQPGMQDIWHMLMHPSVQAARQHDRTAGKGAGQAAARREAEPWW